MNAKKNRMDIAPWGKGRPMNDNAVIHGPNRDKLAGQIRSIHGMRARFSQEPMPLSDQEGWNAIYAGIDDAYQELDYHFGEWRTMPLTVQYGLVHACFTVGIDALKQNRNLLGSLSGGNFQQAEEDSHTLGVHRLVSAQLGNRYEN